MIGNMAFGVRGSAAAVVLVAHSLQLLRWQRRRGLKSAMVVCTCNCRTLRERASPGPRLSQVSRTPSVCSSRGRTGPVTGLFSAACRGWPCEWIIRCRNALSSGRALRLRTCPMRFPGAARRRKREARMTRRALLEHSHRITVRALSKREISAYRNLALNPCDLMRKDDVFGPVLPSREFQQCFAKPVRL